MPLTNDSWAQWTLALRKTIADMNSDRDAIAAWAATISKGK